MKVKHFSKKLVLNKKTVADLNIDEMNAVQGGFPRFTGVTLCVPTCGEPYTNDPCPSRKTDCCIIC